MLILCQDKRLWSFQVSNTTLEKNKNIYGFVKNTYKHTHYTLSVAIEFGHLLLTATRFAPVVSASRCTVRASWLVYQGNTLA